MNFRKSVSVILALAMVMSMVVAIVPAFAAAAEEVYSFTANKVDTALANGNVGVYTTATKLKAQSKNVYVLQIYEAGDGKYYVATTSGDKTIAELGGYAKFTFANYANSVYVAVHKDSASAADAKAIVKGAVVTLAGELKAGVKFSVTKAAAGTYVPVTVDGKNLGIWQKESGFTDCDDNFTFAWYTDDDYLYVDVVFNGKPVSSVYYDANGKNPAFKADGGTRLRLWFNDPEELNLSKFTGLIDVYYVADGLWATSGDYEMYNRAGNWTRFTNNLSNGYKGFNARVPGTAETEGVDRNSVFTFTQKATADSWTVNLKINLDAVGGADGNLQFYPVVSSAYTLSKADDKETTTPDKNTAYNALHYSQYKFWSGGAANVWHPETAISLQSKGAYIEADKVNSANVVNNVAEGKQVVSTNYTFTEKVNNVDTAVYTGNAALTDGATPTGIAYNRTDPNGSDNKNFRGINGSEYFVIDLGAVVGGIGSVDVFFRVSGDGHGNAPKKISVAASRTGDVWTELGVNEINSTLYDTSKVLTWDGGSPVESVVFDKYVAARYIKVSVEGAKTVLSEIKVNAKASSASIKEETWTINGINAWTAGDADQTGGGVFTIVTRVDEFTSPQAVAVGLGYAANYDWWTALYVDANGNLCNVVAAGTAKTLEIPEDGYALLIHSACIIEGLYNKVMAASSEEGLHFELTGIDLENYDTAAENGEETTRNNLSGVSVKVTFACEHVLSYSTDALGYVRYACDSCGYVDSWTNEAGENIYAVAPVTHKNAYNWAAFKSMITNEAGKTFKEASGFTGTMNYQYWILYVIEEKDGKYVVTEYLRDNRSDATKNALALKKCPENGFLFWVFSNESYIYPQAINGGLLGMEAVIINNAGQNMLSGKLGSETPIGYVAFVENSYDYGVNFVTGDNIVSGIYDTLGYADQLTDGVWNLDADGFVGSTLLQNTNCFVEEDRWFDIVYRFYGETRFEQFQIGLNADSNSMVGFADLVNVQTSKDGKTWTDAEYTDDAPETVWVSGGKNNSKGTKLVTVDFGGTVKAEYVRFSFKFPASPFTVANGYEAFDGTGEVGPNIAKPVYEFVGVTEIAPVAMPELYTGFRPNYIAVDKKTSVEYFLELDRDAEFTFTADSEEVMGLIIDGEEVDVVDGEYATILSEGTHIITFEGHKYVTTYAMVKVVPFVEGDIDHAIEIEEPSYVDATITEKHENGIYYTFKLDEADEFNFEVVTGKSAKNWAFIISAFVLEQDKETKEYYRNYIYTSDRIDNVLEKDEKLVNTFSIIADKDVYMEINLFVVDAKDEKDLTGDIQFVVWLNEEKPEAPKDEEKPADNAGDINNDGKINTVDLMMLKYILLDTDVELPDGAEARADIDGNGVVNNIDYMMLKYHILGIKVIGE